MWDHDFKAYPELTNAEMQVLEIVSPFPQIKHDFYATVVKVHDGDTVTLRADFRDFDFPLRFLGIDAPELSEGGADSREWLKSRILGERVYVKIDVNNRVGKYGRLLGRIIHLGLDVGEEEVHLGYAKPYTQRTEGEIPTSFMYFSTKEWF